MKKKTKNKMMTIKNNDMKLLAKSFTAAILLMACTSCGIYNKYVSEAKIPAEAFGSSADMQTAMSETSIAQLSWREFFIDPLLQQLIDTALVRNTDIRSAEIAVKQAQLALTTARLAYLPTLTLAPTGSVSSFDKSAATRAYTLPLQVDWQIDVFGSLTTQKRKTEAIAEQTLAQQDAVRANIISCVAQQYNLLQVLDRQLDILLSTEKLWAVSLETQRVLMENGKAYSTAVNQMEASYLNVKTQIVDTRLNIRNAENALCQLLAMTPQHIERSTWDGHLTPQRLATGVPAEMLTQRADVRAAERAMAAAFYDTAAARAAFYPGITLSGLAGWTNNGAGIADPGKLLLNAVATLTQPIFARGKLRANLKASKLTEQDIANRYAQTVINAGNQVNNALAECLASQEKDSFYKQQVEALRKAYDGTHELMNNGKANYLEVLTAQEAFLQAQLNEAQNLYDGTQASIALYIALGGATK